ncbi:MAG: tetratricopeptide repeat protein [Gammaproteobacteria bacterium]|nr:MAG: tetratricopeptide repeat protein [Gammaproteobacteria bacterium]
MKAQAIQPPVHEVQALFAQLNAGRFAEAEKQARRLLRSWPRDVNINSALAHALAAQGRNDEAVTALRKAVKQAPNVPELQFNLGALSLQAEQLEEAARAFRKAVSLNPRFTDALYNLGVVCQRLGRYEEAAAWYRKAVELEPRFHEAQTNLGVVLQEQGLMGEALRAYEKALGIQPDALVLFNMGAALKNLGFLREAVEHYEKAIRLNPGYALAYSAMAVALRELGQYEEAIAAFHKAFEIEEGLGHAHYHLAELYSDQQRIAEALPHYQQAQVYDYQERVLYCHYKMEQFDTFREKLQAVLGKNHISPFLATLCTHYATNFRLEDPYRFCPDPLSFVHHSSIPELTGEHSELREALLRDIESASISQKMQGRVINGMQSAGNLLKRPEPSFRQLGEIVRRKIREYYQEHMERVGESCLYMKLFPHNLHFNSSWFVKLSQGGYVTSHIHEEGWISGVLYIAMPQHKKDPHEGALEVSTDGDDYPRLHDEFPSAVKVGKVGDIIFFPSSVFHRTIPFHSDEQRICIPFDIRPEVPEQYRNQRVVAHNFL